MLKIKKLALVAGEGDLPAEIFNQCKKDKIEILVLRVSNSRNFKLSHEKFVQVTMDNLNFTIEYLKLNNFKHITFAGRVEHGFAVEMDNATRLKERLSSQEPISQGDNSYYSSIVNFVENMGFHVVGVLDILDEAITTEGIMTKVEPTFACYEDIRLGFKIDKVIGNLDIGQSIIIDNGHVLGVEAAEGTDNLIKRCKLYKSSQKSGILVKAKKGNQDARIDIPVIGENTIKHVYEANLLGVALEARGSIILNKKKVIELADKLGLFIIGWPTGPD